MNQSETRRDETRRDETGNEGRVWSDPAVTGTSSIICGRLDVACPCCLRSKASSA